jgi:hypothetical protein
MGHEGGKMTTKALIKLAQYYPIKHEAMSDVAFVVHKPQYEDEKRLKLRGEWINLGAPRCENAYSMGCIETITIPVATIEQWKPVLKLRFEGRRI